MQTTERFELAAVAYQKGWQNLSRAAMSPDERDQAPRLLQNQIWRLINAGALDASEIATAAVGLIRQDEQILQSQARLKSGEW